MTIDDRNIETFEQIKTFLKGSLPVRFKATDTKEKYSWIQATLVRFNYMLLKKKEKSIVLKYIIKVTGYSDAQTERLVRQYKKTGRVVLNTVNRNKFDTTYGKEDIDLLFLTDKYHGRLNGATTKKILEREVTLFNQEQYKNISGISVSHIYNLRKSKYYVKKDMHFTKTNPTQVNIGERKKPRPDGKPGYIRIDTVHQGDLDKEKGVYHINAVDEETQFEIIFTVPRITVEYLLPALEFILDQFPFTILGFHSDNGREYVNSKVAELLTDLLISFTKSRSRHSNDNALVESKNGAVVRKQFGYSHIPKTQADLINQFNTDYLYYYLNFHRPCFFPVEKISSKGKIEKTYPYENMMTPYEKLKSFKDATQYLKPDTSFQKLDAIAYKMSDNMFAQRMYNAKRKLFEIIYK